jgi:hypothetical protein
MLNRLPRQVPPLSLMLDDIGGVKPRELAKVMGVSERTARGWITRDEAPMPVLMALFWLTKWGRSSVDAEAHNDAVMHAEMARSLADQVRELTARLHRLGRIADFGSANDPAPNVHKPAPGPTEPTPYVRENGGSTCGETAQVSRENQDARIG